MWYKFLISAAAAACLASEAFAGDLVVRVTTPDGKPLADAVVTLPAGAAKTAPSTILEMSQKGRQFAPFVLVAPVGSTVTFPNLDKFRHHVYSFSQGNKFEIQLFGREDKRTYTFKTAGIAALGCNIHDQMVAFVHVVDTPWAEKTSTDGVTRIVSAPEGKTKVFVWHPYAKTRDQTVVQEINVGAGETTVTVVLDIAAPK